MRACAELMVEAKNPGERKFHELMGKWWFSQLQIVEPGGIVKFD